MKRISLGREFFEDSAQDDLLKRIDKKWILKDKVVGYCHSKHHKGYVDTYILKKHECLGKQCISLEKFLELSFWVKRKEVARKKKIDKQYQKQLLLYGDMKNHFAQKRRSARKP